MKEKMMAFLSLFFSAGTLVCCALPALFVLLGFGSVLASLVSVFPFLIWLSEHKPITFGASGLMLLIAGIFYFYSSQKICPTEGKEKDCRLTKQWSFRIYLISVVFFLIGAFFAFALPEILSFL